MNIDKLPQEARRLADILSKEIESQGLVFALFVWEPGAEDGTGQIVMIARDRAIAGAVTSRWLIEHIEQAIEQAKEKVKQ